MRIGVLLNQNLRQWWAVCLKAETRFHPFPFSPSIWGSRPFFCFYATSLHRMNPPQYSCLENPMDRGAWWAAVQRVTRLKQLGTHTGSFHKGGSGTLPPSFQHLCIWGWGLSWKSSAWGIDQCQGQFRLSQQTHHSLVAQTTEMHLFIDLEAGSLRWRCQYTWVLVSALFLASKAHLPAVSSQDDLCASREGGRGTRGRDRGTGRQRAGWGREVCLVSSYKRSNLIMKATLL